MMSMQRGAMCHEVPNGASPGSFQRKVTFKLRSQLEENMVRQVRAESVLLAWGTACTKALSRRDMLVTAFEVQTSSATTCPAPGTGWHSSRWLGL